MALDGWFVRLTFSLLVLSLFLVTIHAALAEPAPATGLTPGASSTRNLSTMNYTYVNATAGYVTPLDINGISITRSWQGYYGDVSGSMILANAQNFTFYEWSNGTVTGEVFASRSNDVDWGSIDCASLGVVGLEETALGQSASDADSVRNTFNQTDHPWFLVGLRNMSACRSTNVFSDGSMDQNLYHQIFLADSLNATVYTTIVNHAALGFDGGTYDFQLLVGEDGHLGDLNPTAYYFWVELGS